MNAPEKLGKFPEWTDSDGPTPYVFRSRLAGHRCAWACHWVAAGAEGRSQIVTPSDWGFFDIADMTPEQVAAELEDNLYQMLILAQPWRGAGMEGQISATLGLQVRLLNGVNGFVRELLASFRGKYGAERIYLNPLNVPTGRNITMRRPGWG